jgi:hypothetical protein
LKGFVMANFLPSREASLVTWSNNFSTLISATPTAFGLTAAQATAFATLNTAWVSAYNTAKNSLTRSPANIITKNAAKKLMIAEARQLAGVIQKFPTITNTQRSELGLNVPNTPSPVPVPSTSPAMEITSVSAWTVNLKLHDSTLGSKRGKPPGVNGAAVFSFVGATAPVDIGSWKFEGNSGRTKIAVSFDSSNPPGTKVWLTAFWFNGRKQSGPACAPITTNLQGGSVSMAA